jgi:hypothetical protein
MVDDESSYVSSRASERIQTVQRACRNAGREESVHEKTRSVSSELLCTVEHPIVRRDSRDYLEEEWMFA